MNVKDAISRLKGVGEVGRALGVSPKAVGMWGARNSVPADQMLPFWRLCLTAGVAWEPPGADSIRHLLRITAPAATVAA